jgi:hypothetical protein
VTTNTGTETVPIEIVSLSSSGAGQPPPPPPQPEYASAEALTAHYQDMVGRAGVRYDFTPEVDEALAVTRWFAEATYTGAPSGYTFPFYNYVNALIEVMDGIQAKPPAERTPDETKILLDLTAVVMARAGEIVGKTNEIWRLNIMREELARLEARQAGREANFDQTQIGTARLFGDDKISYTLGDIETLKRDIANLEQKLNAGRGDFRRDALFNHIKDARYRKMQAGFGNTLLHYSR